MSVTSTEGIDRRKGLAANYYTDPAVFDLEMERIFVRSWIMVGHRSQLEQSGSVIKATVGDESVLITNDGSRLTAMYNVCQHRGHELLTDDSAQLSSITCPYHAWTYGLDGKLLHARGENVGEICVPHVRLDFQAGFMFVNLDPQAPSLAETTPGVEQELLTLAPDASQRVLSARRTHELKANWKVVVENYNECYHCPNVHKYFTQGVVSPGSYQIASSGNVIRHTASSSTSRARHASNPASNGGSTATVNLDSGYGSFYTWPLSSIQCYPGRVLNTFRWVPLAVDRTLLIREWWFDTPEPDEAGAQHVDADWNYTATEDFVIVESVQRGLSSRGYQPGPLIEHPSGVCDVHSENTVGHLQDLTLACLAVDG